MYVIKCNKKGGIENFYIFSSNPLKLEWIISKCIHYFEDYESAKMIYDNIKLSRDSQIINLTIEDVNEGDI